LSIELISHFLRSVVFFLPPAIFSASAAKYTLDFTTLSTKNMDANPDNHHHYQDT
jgi:hypothetical protein